MATSDLLNELNKDSFRAEPDLEAKLTNSVLQQLNDAAGDVSGLAVKWCLFDHFSIFLFAVHVLLVFNIWSLLLIEVNTLFLYKLENFGVCYFEEPENLPNSILKNHTSAIIT
jgi:hypothetical protein